MRCVHSGVCMVTAVCLYKLRKLWSVCLVSGVCLCEMCALWSVMCVVSGVSV